LPGPFGIGELGREAFEFIDYLAGAGQKIWQVLPLNPTGYGDSPYQSFSAFAGNPLLLSLDLLRERGVLGADELRNTPLFPEAQVDFARVIDFKFPLLRKAAKNFFASASASDRAAFDDFCSANSRWLDDYALFMAAKDAHGGIVWTSWDEKLAQRDTAALAEWRERLASAIDAYKYWQFEFFAQWSEIRRRCQQHGIRIMGDIPIYVAHDSADVWAAPHLFHLNPDGTPSLVAGVPPDYFSATGQLWGNPIYRWDLMRENGYAWWIERFRGSLRMFDMVRVDHFRGFEAYWEIPAGESTAINGKWTKGPGAELFRVVTKALGDLPIAAENLGVITPEVEAIRHEFDYPGMALLQFAFGTDPQGPSFRPHNYVRELVAYTGGHDNDTTMGWWNSGIADSTRSEDDLAREHEFTRRYLGFTKAQEPELNWIFIRAVMASVAATVVVPMQDVLGLGSEARMNLPGSMGRNWKWRMRSGDLRPEHQTRLKELVVTFER
jgi:4-alpha-glucanotransferase